MTHQTTLTVVVVSSCGCGCQVDIVIVDEIKNWIGMDGPPKKKNYTTTGDTDRKFHFHYPNRRAAPTQPQMQIKHGGGD